MLNGTGLEGGEFQRDGLSPEPKIASPKLHQMLLGGKKEKKGANSPVLHPFVPLGPTEDWMMPTYVGEDDFLYSVC